jgi:hypothetical protein
VAPDKPVAAAAVGAAAEGTSAEAEAVSAAAEAARVTLLGALLGAAASRAVDGGRGLPLTDEMVAAGTLDLYCPKVANDVLLFADAVAADALDRNKFVNDAL